MSQIEQKMTEVGAALEISYNKADMEAAFRTPLKAFLKDQEAFILSEGIQQEDISLILTTGVTKAKAFRLYAIPFASENLYHAFLKSLTPDVQKLWALLVWEQQMSYLDIEKLAGVKVYAIVKKSWNNGRVDKQMHFAPTFSIFNHSGGYRDYSDRGMLCLWLPELLRKILSQYYPMPPEAILTPLASLPTTAHVFSDGKRDIMMELPRLIVYKDQGQLSVSVKGRILNTTLPKVQRSLNLREFYAASEDKKLRLLRTQSLTNLVAQTGISTNAVTDFPKYIRELFQKIYLKTRTLAFLLSDLKGMGHLDNFNLETTEPKVFAFGALCGAGGCHSFSHG